MSEYTELKALNVSLSEQVKDLSATIKIQAAIIKSLEEKINLLINGRKSNTSSTPPSQDIGRSNTKNSRKSNGLKSGGQAGHKGFTLELNSIPDETIEYTATFCSNCGTNIEAVTGTISECKQEVIIPPVQAKHINHVSFVKTCPCCQGLCKAAMPGHLKAPVQYGANVIAAVCYMSVYQYLPYRRIAVLMRDIYGIALSEGTIDNMLAGCMQKALPAYELIRQKLQQCEVVGSDETGSHIAAKKGWFHVWQNKLLTFIVASMNRGYQTVQQYFPDGFPQTIYISDCWAAQLKNPALHHQLCMVHLLRELSNFEDALACTWSKAMKVLFQEAIHFKHGLTEAACKTLHPDVNLLENRLTVLLQESYEGRHPKVQAFHKRLIKNRQSIFTFLYHFNVPADNNGSERAVRNVKVKTKVSGQFKTEAGAQRFAVLRSVVDTTTKNGQSVFDALRALAELVPT